jgi:signal peptidase
VRTALRTAHKVLSWLLLATVVAAGVALIGLPKAVGAKPLTVLTGSMAGTYDPGDVVVVRPTDARELEVGDVITFQPVSDDPRLTTHRVVGVTYGSEGVGYVTQGDANDTPDPEPVRPVQVRGEVWYAVPLVGYVSVWMATGLLGDLVRWAAIGLILYGGWFVASGLRERARADRRHPEVADRG